MRKLGIAVLGIVLGLEAGEVVRLSQSFTPRVAMRVNHGFSVNWAPTFDHVALYASNGQLLCSFLPRGADLVFQRIGDVAIWQDGSFILATTLSGSIGALVFATPQCSVERVVRISPGFAAKIAVDAEGRIWTAGRSPDGTEAAISVFDASGKLIRSRLPHRELPVPLVNLQMGTTALAPWRDGMAWVLPEQGTVFLMNSAGDIARKITLASPVKDPRGAWILQERLVIAFVTPDGEQALRRIDLVTGQESERRLAQGGYPVGIDQNRIVRHDSRSSTLTFEPLDAQVP